MHETRAGAVGTGADLAAPLAAQEDVVRANQRLVKEWGALSAVQEAGLAEGSLLQEPRLGELLDALHKEMAQNCARLAQAAPLLSPPAPGYADETSRDLVSSNIPFLAHIFEIADLFAANRAVISSSQEIQDQIMQGFARASASLKPSLVHSLFSAAYPADICFETARLLAAICLTSEKTLRFLDLAYVLIPNGCTVSAARICRLYGKERYAAGVRGWELLAPAVYVEYREASKAMHQSVPEAEEGDPQLQELIHRIDPKWQADLEKHFDMVRRETLAAAEFLEIPGDGLLLGTGRLRVFPIADILRLSLGGREPRFRMFHLVELGHRMVVERLAEYRESGFLTPEELERTAILKGDASFMLAKLTPEIDRIIETGGDRKEVQARLKELLRRLSLKGGLTGFICMDRCGFTLPENSLSFVVFAMAAQDFVLSLETYIACGLMAHGWDERALRQIGEHLKPFWRPIQIGLARSIMNLAADKLQPGGILFYCDECGVVPAGQ